jgi:1,4-alpha-glucan branching enzyme
VAGVARPRAARLVLLEQAAHRHLRDFCRELNHLYLASPQFYGSDADYDGFRWVDLHNADESVWAFQRRCTDGDTGAPYTCVFNATPVPRDQYSLGVSELGRYRKILDTDEGRFGGSGYNSQSMIEASHGRLSRLRPFPEGRSAAARGAVLRRAGLTPMRGIQAGLPKPLGATWTKRGVNFALFSSHATRVELCLYDAITGAEQARVDLPARTGDVWHGASRRGAPAPAPSTHIVHGPNDPEKGHRFDSPSPLIDPYARELSRARRLRARVVDPRFAWGGDRPPAVPWRETVIYELHVKGYTQRHPAVPEAGAANISGSPSRRCWST